MVFILKLNFINLMLSRTMIELITNNGILVHGNNSIINIPYSITYNRLPGESHSFLICLAACNVGVRQGNTLSSLLICICINNFESVHTNCVNTWSRLNCIVFVKIKRCGNGAQIPMFVYTDDVFLKPKILQCPIVLRLLFLLYF